MDVVLAPPLVTSGKVDLRELMRAAVRQARMLRAGGATWQWRMSLALRTVWGWAKAKIEADRQRRTDTRKMALDRGQAIALLSRIQSAPINRGRDIVGQAHGMSNLDDVLQLARAEFRALPEADKPAVLATLPAPEIALPIRAIAARIEPTRRTYTFDRGSRIHSHGW